MYETLFNGPVVTLTDMLEARENRASTQKELLLADPQASLIVATMNIPGPVKSSGLLKSVFETLVLEIEKVTEETVPIANLYRNLSTGPEYFLVLPIDKYDVKARMVQIEQTNPYGRLLDLDVLYLDEVSNQVLPISRTELGVATRTCFVCGQPAKECGRSRKHSMDELYREIQKIIEEE